MVTGARDNSSTGPTPVACWRGCLGRAGERPSVTRTFSRVRLCPLWIETFDRLRKVSDSNDPNGIANTLLGVRYVLATEPQDDLTNFELSGIAYESLYYERTDPFPRAWIATDARVEPDDDTALAQLADPATDLHATVYLDRALECESGGGDATIRLYDTNELQIERRRGWRAGSRRHYNPGWRAEVDGEEVTIARADVAFRAVCVPPGEHTVTFTYRPLSFYAGAAISAAGWALWALVWVLAWRVDRRGHPAI
jgi:hypothetical protein